VVSFVVVNASVPESEEHIIAACERALSIAPPEWPVDLPPSKELFGAREWYPFEHEAWAIGESIRRALVKHPKLKKRTALVSKVAEVATCRNLRHGRQSFVMAIGFVDACPFAATLVPFLRDADVEGHVIDTLLKMKAGGFSHAVSPLLQSEKSWIRRKARKYVDRYPLERTV
jgi:hypothetical protein